MKKSQVTLFIIFGLLMLFIIGYFFSTSFDFSNKRHADDSQRLLTLSDVNTDSKGYINYCINDASQKAIEEVGIRKDTVEIFKLIIERNLKICTNSLLDELKKQGYNVSTEKITIVVELSEQTVIVNVNYPVTIERNGPKIEFSDFYYVFDRSSSKNVPQGFTQDEMKIISANRKAQVIIPKGTRITDKNGNVVENVGTRVEDVHFDGLENKYVLGQIVYDNFPDGARFSEPVELSIKFDEIDIPEGYTKDDLMIGYWNEKDMFWHAVPTEINDGVATAKIDHFSIWTILGTHPHVIEQMIGKNRFKPFSASVAGGDKDWVIGGEEKDKSGTVSVKLFDNDFDENGLEAIFNAKGPEAYEDFRETLKLHESEFFPLPPIFEYGYETDADTGGNDLANGIRFVNCEPEPGTELEENGLTYFMKDNLNGKEGLEYGVDVDFPYFKQCNDGSVKNDVCKCPENEDCECDTINVGFPIDFDKYCMSTGVKLDETGKPIDSSQQGSYYECSVKTDDSCPASIEQFGYHDSRCSGFLVSPADAGPDAAFYIIFENNGNAVLYELEDLKNIEGTQSMDLVYEYPSKDGSNFYDNYFRIGDEQKLAYYAAIINYEDDDSRTRAFLLNNIDPINPKIGGESGSPALGVNKVLVVKDPSRKGSLQANGYLYWTFIGNGFVRANTPAEMTREWDSGTDLYITLGEKMYVGVSDYIKKAYNKLTK
jgi:hypothetical protein